jgi:magnesium chelatase family protein
LLERIDMHVFVDALPYREYFKADGGEKSEAVQQRVLAARTRQEERQGSGLSNARLSSVFLHRILRGDVKLRKWFELVMEKERFSARVIEKVLRLARTIADLDGSCTVQLKHAKEALAFRLLDRSIFRA